MKKQPKKKGSANTSLLHTNILIICLCYGFMGANFIIPSIFENTLSDTHKKLSIMLGIVMLCMAPVSYFDKRKEMRRTFSVVMCCILHLTLSIWCSYIYSSWLIMLLYAVEIVIIMSVVLVRNNKIKNN